MKIENWGGNNDGILGSLRKDSKERAREQEEEAMREAEQKEKARQQIEERTRRFWGN